FYAEEEALADAKLEKMAMTHIVRRLAPLASYFILDAFAAAHRAQPSLVGFCEVLPSLAGRVMERELTMLARAVQDPARPKVAHLGGVKVDDSIAVAKHMLEKDIVDTVLTSGGVGNLFLDASGIDLGDPTTDFMHREVEDYDHLRGECKELLRKYSRRILIPTDVVLNDNGERRPVTVSGLPAKLLLYDIGLDTIARYVDVFHRAKTIFFNGPAGVFELEPFSVGTRELLTAVAEAPGMGGGTRPRFPPRPEDVRPLRALVQPRRRAPRLRRGRAARAAVRAHFVGGVPRLPRRLGPRERPLGRRRPPRKSGGRADDGQPAADPRSFRILRPHPPE